MIFLLASLTKALLPPTFSDRSSLRPSRLIDLRPPTVLLSALCLQVHKGAEGYWYYPCLSALDWDTGLPTARYHTIKMLVEQLGGSQMKAVSPVALYQPQPPIGIRVHTAACPSGSKSVHTAMLAAPVPGNRLVGFGFTVVGEGRRLLLVNTGCLNASVAVANGSGAMHVFIDEAHGHGVHEPGQHVLGASGVVDVGGYGVSVVAWPAD